MIQVGRYNIRDNYSGCYDTTLMRIPILFSGNYFISPTFLQSCEEVLGYRIVTWRDLRQFFADYRSNMSGSSYSYNYAMMFSYLFRIELLSHSVPLLREILSSSPRIGHLDSPIYREEGIRLIENTQRDVGTFVLLEETQPQNEDQIEVLLLGSNHNFIEVVRNEAIASTPEGNPWDAIRNYSWRPEVFEFRSLEKERTHTYFGMELEVSTDISPLELQKIVTEVQPTQERFFYMKDDTSISRTRRFSYEIVTIPMSPAKQKKEWKTLFKKLEKLCEGKGLALSDVFDTAEQSNNGLHIHVSKDAFIETVNQFHLRKFFTAWNQSQSSYLLWLQRVAKRPTSLQDHTYCRPHALLEGKTLPRRMRERGTSRRDYHHSLCHETRDTLEVRVFQGLPNLKHILSCIEMVEAFLDFSREMPYSAIRMGFERKFTEWVLKKPVGYRNLKETLECA